MTAAMSMMSARAYMAMFSWRMFPTTVLEVNSISAADVCWNIIKKKAMKANNLACIIWI